MYTRPNLNEDDFTVGDLLLGNYELDENEEFSDFVYDCFLETNVPGLKVLPAKPSDRMYEASVVRKQFEANLAKAKYAPQEALKKLVDSVRDKFDVIFLDCSPSFGVSVTSAHYVADSLIIPVTPSQLDRDSSVKYFGFLGQLYSKVLGGFNHSGYEHINVLPTAVDETSKSETQTARKLRQGASRNCFSGNFLYSEAVLNTANRWQTIYSVSKSQYNGTKKTLGRIQEATFSLIASLHEQIENIALKQDL
jgi:cellulose biosynthesis protein BcsQ